MSQLVKENSISENDMDLYIDVYSIDVIIVEFVFRRSKDHSCCVTLKIEKAFVDI